jgi:hypothetical protein
MSHLAIALLIVGAFVFIVGTVKAVSAYLENRGEEMAPFRNYFGPEHDGDLLGRSSWCDDKNQYDRRTRMDAFKTRERSVTERDSSGGGTTSRSRDKD